MMPLKSGCYFVNVRLRVKIYFLLRVTVLEMQHTVKFQKFESCDRTEILRSNVPSPHASVCYNQASMSSSYQRNCKPSS